MQTLNAVRVTQQLLLPKVASATCIVDATAGNGKDTLFLAKNSPANSKIYAFDVQEAAIQATRKRVTEHKVDDKVQLILDSHDNVASYIDNPIHVAVFNLGYLPGECHATMTMSQSTLGAVEAIVSQLADDGIISIIAYPGHQQGEEENIAVRNYTMTLPAEQFTVLCVEMINHGNHPPIVYLIEKTRKKSTVKNGEK